MLGNTIRLHVEKNTIQNNSFCRQFNHLKWVLKYSYEYLGREQRFGHCFLIIWEMIDFKYHSLNIDTATWLIGHPSTIHLCLLVLRCLNVS